MRNSVIVANESYDIWWIYTKDKMKYVGVINKYIGFLSSSIHAHFVAMLLSISKVLDLKDRKNLSILTLINYAKEHALIDESILQNSEKELFKQKELISKIQILRNNHFAHISKNLKYSQVLQKAEIKYDDFKNIIDASGKILNDISYAFDLSKLSSFGFGAENDTHLLLGTLIDAEKK